MLSKEEIEQKLHELKPLLAEQFFVSRIGYFGSYTSGQQCDNSDLDLLVEFSKPVGWNFFTLEKFLETVFGLKIDLITKNALKERTKQKILNQIIYV